MTSKDGPRKRGKSGGKDEASNIEMTESAVNSRNASKKDAADASSSAPKSGGSTKFKPKKPSRNLVQAGTYLTVLFVLGYSCLIGRTMYRICYPLWDLSDEDGRPVKMLKNKIRPSTPLTVKLFIFDEGENISQKYMDPAWEIDFDYSWDSKDAFGNEKLDVPVAVPERLLKEVKKKILRVQIHDRSKKKQPMIAASEGSLIKYIDKKEEPRKYNLIRAPYSDIERQNELCPVKKEPIYSKTVKDKYDDDMLKEYRVRGLPKMQIRLVYDTEEYPWYFWGSKQDYYPQSFVDEFWLTDDQLIVFDQDDDMKTKEDSESEQNLSVTNIKNNSTDSDSDDRMLHFNSSLYFDLMSAERWRFQRTMEVNLENTAKTFGEDSEEMLQMRDLFANTSPTLLITTFIVSILHSIFEILAFKSDVQFWNSQTPEILNKYVSVRAVLMNIVFELILLLYLWDQGSNFLVLIFSVVSIVIECWKVTRAMKFNYFLALGFLPIPYLETKTTNNPKDAKDKNSKKSKSNSSSPSSSSSDTNYDLLAMQYLSIVIIPLVISYASYNLFANCHKGWYSYTIETLASCVYAGGFVLMTPQLFINYKFKSVAYLPWRRFVYRALNTFIDDLFSFIIRMPTMHRMSCFRDDVVFFIYLYQRWIYPTDKSRTFDEDEGVVEDDESRPSGSSSTGIQDIADEVSDSDEKGGGKKENIKNKKSKNK